MPTSREMERWHFETDTTFLLWFSCVQDVASTVLVSGRVWDWTVIVSRLICHPPFLILTGSIVKHLLVPHAPDEIAQLPRGKCVVGDKSLIHQTASKHNPTADSAAPPQDYRLLCATYTLIQHIVGLLLGWQSHTWRTGLASCFYHTSMFHIPRSESERIMLHQTSVSSIPAVRATAWILSISIVLQTLWIISK